MPQGLQTFFPDGSIDLDTSTRTGRWLGQITLTAGGVGHIFVPRAEGEQIIFYLHNFSNYYAYAYLTNSAGTAFDETSNRLQYQATHYASPPFTGTIHVLYGVY